MTRNARLAASELFGEGMIRRFETLERARGALPAPRSARTLVEDVAVLGIGQDDVVVDVGAWGGLWSERLSARYGCHCIALDLSQAYLLFGKIETAAWFLRAPAEPGVPGPAARAVLPERAPSAS